VGGVRALRKRASCLLPYRNCAQACLDKGTRPLACNRRVRHSFTLVCFRLAVWLLFQLPARS